MAESNLLRIFFDSVKIFNELKMGFGVCNLLLFD